MLFPADKDRQFLSLQSEINVPIQTSNKDIVPARLHVPKHVFHQQRFCFCDTVIFFFLLLARNFF